MVLDDADVRRAIADAWLRSEPGTRQAHEEGGFVVRQADGLLFVIGWPRGLQNEIFVPPHSAGRRGNMPIIATFHTHPNFGPGYQQEPSLTDIRAVRDDPDLSHVEYEGEYVISRKFTYRVLRTGDIEVVGETAALFQLDELES